MRSVVDGYATEFEVTGTGRPVLLLHGFPDSGNLWRHQVPVLSVGGYQLIVPDLRGYGHSAKPADVESYGLLHLASDVIGILDSLGIERAHVVGHDWGAALSWLLAALQPERVDHLVALSVGHPAAFAQAGLPQREKSWYMLLFQFPDVAEQWLSDDDWANFRAWSQHPDADAAIAELEANDSLTPALNWYRANVPPTSLIGPRLALPPVQAPAMGVWSDGDRFLTEAQMTGSQEHVQGSWRYERLEGPGHWMQLEARDAVSRLLTDFLPA
jgi:pimeloyl-ACP methyl ester carboxylesterase